MLRLASLFVIALVSFSKGHVMLSHPPLFHDLSVLNADNPICKAGNILSLIHISAAGNLITKLKNADLIEPVSGFGKGKYKFIPPKE